MKKAEEYLKSNKYDIIDAIGNSFYNTVSYQIHEEIVKEIIKQAQIDAIEATAKACEFNFVSGMRKLPIEMVVDELKKELE